ncbi:ATP-dependent Clp protease adaptor ClpS [Arcobacter sp. FWKO B]|uniref:ATP-dependent Clp protease adaptor ClpS n=1 Tax=Arcobacter sp. FWKO B TaxID=2593672 RepID=UPI0018A4E425|nr:ATP-dependent Clp protease adaptor ClpS [Arcobacter sp. FWKO B]QOG13311.1 ATP-dependent Clp protease adaptor ClpS [Arcobacter sp. FWKO B]
MYRVILLNDNYSTMDFVIEVLMKVFRKSLEDATKIMLNIHNNGQEICGVYTHEIAITKVAQVRNMARAKNFPLKAIIQED